MAQLLIRNIDDGIVARLKEKAAEQHTSLEQFLRDLLSREASLGRAAQLAGLRAFREEAGEVAFDFTGAIRDDRESR